MPSDTNRTLRCAIYTRKSSEEGLEQSFNSLDAQREACAAFILSQRHEGWVEVSTRYDDGGFSGGSMNRPALAALMRDIDAGLIDSVVVYKVDRLTRALSDFAKIVDCFDAKKVSFVSVTQQFNTTTSMGRLTLNVLLSFAQFEREVTGERIRDKIAASKKKGMWMGGRVPMGYDLQNRKLVINEAEANAVCHFYQRYLALGCVSALKAELDSQGVVSKVRISRTGKTSGGLPYSRGALYELCRTAFTSAKRITSSRLIRASTSGSSIRTCGAPCRRSFGRTRRVVARVLGRANRACWWGAFSQTKGIASFPRTPSREANATGITFRRRVHGR